MIDPRHRLHSGRHHKIFQKQLGDLFDGAIIDPFVFQQMMIGYPRGICEIRVEDHISGYSAQRAYSGDEVEKPIQQL